MCGWFKTIPKKYEHRKHPLYSSFSLSLSQSFQSILRKMMWFHWATASHCMPHCRDEFICDIASALIATANVAVIQPNAVHTSVHCCAVDANQANYYQIIHLIRHPIGIATNANGKCPQPIFNTLRVVCNLPLKTSIALHRTILKHFWKSIAIIKRRPQMERAISLIQTFCCMSEIHLYCKSNMH